MESVFICVHDIIETIGGIDISSQKLSKYEGKRNDINYPAFKTREDAKAFIDKVNDGFKPKIIELKIFSEVKEEKPFEQGEKVIFIPENKVYDFGYIGATGKAIIYEEGESNMQDSYAVDLKKLKRKDEK